MEQTPVLTAPKGYVLGQIVFYKYFCIISHYTCSSYNSILTLLSRSGGCFSPWMSSCGFSSLKKNCRNDSRWFWKLEHKRLCGFLLVGWNVMLGYETCSHHVSIPFSLRPSSCEARLGRLSALRRSARLLLPWTPAAPATIWLQPNRKF